MILELISGLPLPTRYRLVFAWDFFLRITDTDFVTPEIFPKLIWWLPIPNP